MNKPNNERTIRVGNLVELISEKKNSTGALFIVTDPNPIYEGYIEVLSPVSNRKRMINRNYLKILG